MSTDETPETIPHVHEQQWVATCAQCQGKARGGFRELIDGGWVVMPAGHVSEEPSWFCPACVTHLERVP